MKGLSRRIGQAMPDRLISLFNLIRVGSCHADGVKFWRFRYSSINYGGSLSSIQ